MWFQSQKQLYHYHIKFKSSTYVVLVGLKFKYFYPTVCSHYNENQCFRRSYKKWQLRTANPQLSCSCNSEYTRMFNRHGFLAGKFGVNHLTSSTKQHLLNCSKKNYCTTICMNLNETSFFN